MATSRPKAVVTRASEIPPATAPIPEVFWVAICWKALRIRTTVPKRHMKGARRAMRLLGAVPQLDRLIETAFLEGGGNLGRELAGLLAGGVEVESAVDDH